MPVGLKRVIDQVIPPGILTHQEEPDVGRTLDKAKNDRQVPGVLVDLLSPRLPFFLEFHQRRPDGPQQLKNDRRRDVRHDPETENRCLTQIGATENCRFGNQRRQRVRGRALRLCLQHFAIDHGHRNLITHPINGQQKQRQKDLPTQFRNRKNDA